MKQWGMLLFLEQYKPMIRSPLVSQSNIVSQSNVGVIAGITIDLQAPGTIGTSEDEPAIRPHYL